MGFYSKEWVDGEILSASELNGNFNDVGYPTEDQMSSTVINFSSSMECHYKRISASAAFTFSNLSNKTIKVAVEATGAYTCTFNSVLWEGGSAPTQTSTKIDLYSFTYINGSILGKRDIANMTGAWPYGIDGALTILNGETVNVAAGSIKDYSSLTINTGGILNITGNSTDVTMIGVSGNFTLAGTITCKNSNVNGSVSIITPDNTAFSKTVAVNGNGGNGGRGGFYSSTTGGGGGTASGHDGAGGGGGQARAQYSDTPGGKGGNTTVVGISGTGQGSGGSYTGGSGGIVSTSVSTNGNNGSAAAGTTSVGGAGGTGGGGGGGGGADVDTSPTGSAAGGGGGGGGIRGNNGKNLYIRVKGVFNGTGGAIDCSGSTGGTGGAGGNGVISGGGAYTGAGGGGGGGGGGGSGGNIIIKYVNIGSYTAPTITVAAGAGGTGGTKGTGAGSTGSEANGSNGTAGSAGSSAASQY